MRVISPTHSCVSSLKHETPLDTSFPWPRPWPGSHQPPDTQGSQHPEDPEPDAECGPQVMRLCQARSALRGPSPRGQVCWLLMSRGSILLQAQEKSSLN